MMIGESTRTLKVTPWDPFDVVLSPSANAGFLDSLHRFLPSNLSDEDNLDNTCLVSSDQFRMFEFKIRRCARGRSHDWTECPYAHPGEKARRRDPRKYHYSGSACPEFRKGFCAKGDSCEFAHGVFECWLHPARYRTQPCNDGLGCHRRVCFFAHTPQQLRILPVHGVMSSPPVSPPMSPNSPLIRGFKMSNNNMQTGCSPVSWVGSPRGPLLRPDFFSLPNTPTRGNPGRCGPGAFELWEQSLAEEPAMERVESGRDLRARMYAKLIKESSMGRVDSVGFSGADVDWVSELVSEEET